MNSQKIAKFLMGSTVTSMVLLCLFVPLTHIVDVKVWVSYLLGVALAGSVFQLYFVLWDKRSRLVVKTRNLPVKVLLWGAILSGMSFCTMMQTVPLSALSQALLLFAATCLTCAAMLAGLLWLTTQQERPGLYE